jgi:type IV secretory pathway VirB4 component
LNYDDQNSTSKKFNILLDRFKSTNIKLYSNVIRIPHQIIFNRHIITISVQL